MGFHLCEYCIQTANSRLRLAEQLQSRAATSSGDVVLYFPYQGLGHTWVMPDMIIHYVQAHHYLPPQDFIDDVMQSVHIAHSGTQTNAVRVGYLKGDFPQGQVPDGFLEKLENFLTKAREQGDRWQTRGF